MIHRSNPFPAYIITGNGAGLHHGGMCRENCGLTADTTLSVEVTALTSAGRTVVRKVVRGKLPSMRIEATP